KPGTRVRGRDRIRAGCAAARRESSRRLDLDAPSQRRLSMRPLAAGARRTRPTWTRVSPLAAALPVLAAIGVSGLLVATRAGHTGRLARRVGVATADERLARTTSPAERGTRSEAARRVRRHIWARLPKPAGPGHPGRNPKPADPDSHRPPTPGRHRLATGGP